MNIPQLTFIRFLAAFLIILFHFAKENVYPFDLLYINEFIRKGSFAVSFFFFLSGFIMIIAYFKFAKLKVKEYYINRFARIYPVFLLSMVLFLFAWFLVKGGLNIFDSIISVFMIQSWIPGKELILNTPAWSIGVELFFYLLFPFLFFIYKRVSYKIITVFVFLFFILSQLYLHFYISDFNRQFFLYNPIFHLNTFLLGNWTALTLIKNPNVKPKDWIWASSLVLMIVFIMLNNTIIIHNGLLVIFYIPILFYFSISQGIIAKTFSRKAFVFLGEISYGLYILQFSVFIPVSRILEYFGFLDTMNFYISTVILTISSILIYKLYETPLRKTIKESFSRN